MFDPRYLWIGFRQLLCRQALPRTPETSGVSSGELQSEHYSSVLKTSMALLYALALDDLRQRLPGGGSGLSVLELCCGPGRFSVLAARMLGVASWLGVDLSRPMLNSATAHARANGFDGRLRFDEMDITGIATALQGRKFDLVLFMNGAHHLGNPETVRDVLRQASDLCAPGGLVYVMDPIRPRNGDQVELLVSISRSQAEAPGLTEFHRDYQESLHASFTAAEFVRLAPEGTGRRWIHRSPGLVPSCQILIGQPEGRRPDRGRGLSPGEIAEIVPPGLRTQFRLLRFDFWLSALARSCRR